MSDVGHGTEQPPCVCGHSLDVHTGYDDVPCEGTNFVAPGSFVSCECGGFRTAPDGSAGTPQGGAVTEQSGHEIPHQESCRVDENSEKTPALLHAACRYWLAEESRPMSIKLVDGCHDSPEGVAKAARLHQRIFNSHGPFLMVEIHELPDMGVEINEEAAATCARLVMEGTPDA